MPYDPERGFLSEEDLSLLERIHNLFLRRRLAKVGPRSLQGHLIGKLLAEAEKKGISWQEFIAGRLPVVLQVARAQFGLTKADEQAIEYSRLHAAHYVAEMADRLKERVRETVTRAVTEKTPPMQLSHQLFQQFGEGNRDWRRVALTETNIAVANGYLASMPEGEVLVGDSAVDCCDWCQEHLQGRAFISVPEAPEPAEGFYYTQQDSWGKIWPGKTNVGRSRYPTRSDGTPRSADELWHPCIPAHPHCRCRWRRLIETAETVEPGTNRVVPKTNLGI